MCKKIDARIECYECGYPYSEARFPDSSPPLPCDASDKIIEDHQKLHLETILKKK